MSLKKIVIFASGADQALKTYSKSLVKMAVLDVVKLYCNNPNAYVLKRFEKHEIDKMIFNNSDLETGKVLEDLIKLIHS